MAGVSESPRETDRGEAGARGEIPARRTDEREQGVKRPSGGAAEQRNRARSGVRGERGASVSIEAGIAPKVFMFVRIGRGV